MSDSPTIMKLPFDEAPCQCVTAHRPTPLEIEKHHPYPQAAQIKRYGKVVDKRIVPLCDTAHKNVHVALAKRLKGENFRLGNRYLEGIVQEGLQRIRNG